MHFGFLLNEYPIIKNAVYPMEEMPGYMLYNSVN